MATASVGRILDLAIQNEIEAQRFYRSLSEDASDAETRDTLDYLADEEAKHQEFLERYRRGEVEVGSLGADEPVDYKIAEYFEEPSYSDEMKSEDAFLIAAHREKLSHEFYLTLANLHPEGEVREMLRAMAQQELGHKEKMEYLYSNTAFRQTAGG